MPTNNISKGLMLFGFIVAVVTSIFIIYVLLLKITGHSPTTSELALSIAVLSLSTSLTLVGFILKINDRVSKTYGKINELSGRFDSFEKHAISNR